MLQYALANLMSGGAYALLGVCLVLMYRMLGVLNFAQGVIGAFGTYAALAAYGAGLPYLLAVIIGMAAGAGLAAAMGLIMASWFAEASLRTRSAVTIALMISTLVISYRVFGTHPQIVPQLLPGQSLAVGDVVIPLATLAIVCGTVVLAAAVHLFLRFSHIGVLLRALAERPTTAELLAVPVRRLAIAVWAATGAIASLALVVIAPTRVSDFLSLSLLILPALAAALVGLFRSVSLAVAGGLLLGLCEGVASAFPAVAQFRQVLPLLVMLVALLWSQRAEVWDAAR